MDRLIALGKCISNSLDDAESNARSHLDNFRKDNLNKIVSACLNFNSIINKYNQLVNLIKGRIDVIIIFESIINDAFTESQFSV